MIRCYLSISLIINHFDKINLKVYNNVIMKGRVKKEEVMIVHPINTMSARSIEEMAKLGMPFSILAKSQQTWLIRGGLEYLKKTKPYLYPLVEKMVNNKDQAFPEGETLLGLAEEVLKKLEWERDQAMGILSWIERILRWKIEPFHTRSEKIRKIACTLKEVLEEKYKKDPEGYRYLYKSISEWVKWNKRSLMLMGEKDYDLC